MTEWLRRLEDLKTAVERLSERQEERDAAQAAVAKAREALAADLTNLGDEPASPEDSLVRLMGQAETLLERAQNTRHARAELERKLDEGERHKLRRESAVAQAEADLGQWSEQWAKATQALRLGEQPAVARVTAVLRVYTELDAENKEADRLDRRLKGIDRDAADFERDVARLVGELAPELAGLTVVDATRELQDRVAKAREARTLVDQLSSEIAGHEADMATAEEDLGEAQRELQALAKLARCGVEELASAWERHRQRLEVEDAIRETEEQLGIAGDGRSLADLQAEACGRDQVAVRLRSLEEEAAAANEQREQQRKLVWELERAAAASDGSAAAAARAEERQALVADIRDEVEQYLTLAVARQLLVQAIKSYRAANQDPMLPRANDLFGRMTGHLFSGLSLEYGDADHPVLVGVRANGGSTVTVEGMSDGTCDQLYLALRLAAIEQFARRVEPLPLLVDDILIRFDDERARETLAVLGEVAQSHQVIFFTHHRRLGQLADEVFGAGKYGRRELSA